MHVKGALKENINEHPFPKDETTRVLEIVHTNVCGLMKTSCGGTRFFVTYIDDFSKEKVYCLKAKGYVFDQFEKYKALMKK